MKRWSLGLIVLAGVASAAWWYFNQPQPSPISPTYTGGVSSVTHSTTTETIEPPAPRVAVVAENLTIPWEVVFLPGGELLITERPGTVLLVQQGVEIEVPGVRHIGEGGMLGAALHPDFENNRLVYLYQTTETDAGLRNRVNRYELIGNELRFHQTIVEDLPGARYHDGGRIAFGPDGYLYVTLGDAQDPDAAQETDRLAGSILRYTAEGEIPASNPFGNAIYSYGHRNPQGLAWTADGQLWSSEHGRSGIRSGFDEINLIQTGSNYGWPDYQGDESAPDITTPVRHSGPDTTWAPGDIAYIDGTLYMTGLRGETLYEAKIDGATIIDWREHFVGEYGRLRSVIVGPDGMLYLTTSNRDGRGSPAKNDDRIIRVNPALLSQ